MTIPKIRSMAEAYQEIKKQDPETTLTYYMFRKLILSGEIPSLKTNGKYLVKLDDVSNYFENNFGVA